MNRHGPWRWRNYTFSEDLEVWLGGKTWQRRTGDVASAVRVFRRVRVVKEESGTAHVSREWLDGRRVKPSSLEA